MELLSSCRRLPVPPGRRAVDHAQQRSDRQLAPDLQPRFELAPRPAVHAHLTSLSAFPAADEDRAAHDVEVGLLKRQGFADSESRAPKQHDQRAQSLAIRANSDGSHHRDDLLDRRRVGRVVLALVARRAPRW